MESEPAVNKWFKSRGVRFQFSMYFNFLIWLYKYIIINRDRSQREDIHVPSAASPSAQEVPSDLRYSRDMEVSVDCKIEKIRGFNRKEY